MKIFNPDVIRTLAWKKKITQIKLSEAVGVGPQTVNHWFNGRHCPPANKLPLLAEALSCNESDFFTNEIVVQGGPADDDF